jgi:peptidoglycan/LPS O-acetylase OafA/YrhL
MFLPNFVELRSPNVAVQLGYAATSLAHQAVVIFFVLSGFLVGGSVLSSMDRWNWKRYLVSRFTRLYLVLIPALLVTAFCDYISRHEKVGPFYFNYLKHFNTVPSPQSDTLNTFFGNMAFLQTICVPTFGSDLPLWSLAKEFWYYLLFPALLVATVAPVSRLQKRISAALACCLLILLPHGMLSGFLVWMLGVAVFSLPHLRIGERKALLLSAGSGVVFFLGLLVAHARLGADFGDLILGIAFVPFLFSLTRVVARASDAAPGYQCLGHVLSRCSYSVYAIHFPLMMVVRCAIAERAYRLSFRNVSFVTLLCGALFCAGYAFSCLTERNTDSVRKWIFEVLGADHSSRAREASPNPA